MKTESPSFIASFYRLLLRLYPSPLRQEFGDEMADTVDQRWREVLARSGSAAGFAGQILRDTLVSHTT